MSNECPDCDDIVRPLAQEFEVESGYDGDDAIRIDEDESSVWFLVCPKCHYVFDRFDEDDFTTAPN